MKTLRLRIQAPPAVTKVLSFTGLPVRVGRDPECECRFDYTFVSRRHATIDVRDGRLAIRDEGSRAGTRGGRELRPLPLKEWIDLETLDNVFWIGPLEVQVVAEDGARVSARPTIPSDEFQSVDSEDFESSTVHYESAEVDPSALDTRALQQAVADAARRHRDAIRELSSVLSQAASLPEDRMRELLGRIVEMDPEWDASPVRIFAERCGLRPPSTRPEVVALQALEQLASENVPYAPPLQGVASVAAFATRLEQVLEVFATGIAALQYAYRAETEGPRTDVPDPRVLAARLLNWTADPSPIEELHEELTAMVAHHGRLVAEALGGIDKVLEHLRPAAIDRDARRNWAPFPHRRRWKLLVERYEAVRRERSAPLGRTLISVAEALGLMRAPSRRVVDVPAERPMQLLPA